MPESSLEHIIRCLTGFYGVPDYPPWSSVLEIVIWENVAYLADDDKRLAAFRLLKETVGTEPEQVIDASDDALMGVAKYSVMPQQTVGKLRTIAGIALSDFPNGVDRVLALDPKHAMRELRKFPAIGEPSAQKILLFFKAWPVLALDSNGLRVLQRLGFGKDTGRYASDYRAAQSAASLNAPHDFDFLIVAHQLLRTHGKETCRRGTPACGGCPLNLTCPSAQNFQVIATDTAPC